MTDQLLVVMERYVRSGRMIWGEEPSFMCRALFSVGTVVMVTSVSFGVY